MRRSLLYLVRASRKLAKAWDDSLTREATLSPCVDFPCTAIETVVSLAVPMSIPCFLFIRHRVKTWVVDCAFVRDAVNRACVCTCCWWWVDLHVGNWCSVAEPTYSCTGVTWSIDSLPLKRRRVAELWAQLSMLWPLVVCLIDYPKGYKPCLCWSSFLFLMIKALLSST
jgi:hypothetical protein